MPSFYAIVFCICNNKKLLVPMVSAAPCCKPYSLYHSFIVLQKDYFYEILQILVIPRLHCNLHQTSLLTPTKLLYGIYKSSEHASKFIIKDTFIIVTFIFRWSISIYKSTIIPSSVKHYKLHPTTITTFLQTIKIFCVVRIKINYFHLIFKGGN
jgi:hypothetical protein